MDMRQLKYFLAVAEELHFSRAAEKLFMAQPPLTRQIKQLEEHLGVALFHRTKRKVDLTEAGKHLQREAIKLIAQLKLVEEEVRLAGKGALGQIKIGYVGATMHSILPDLLIRLTKAYPEVNTVLLELSNEGQVEALLTGRIDVGFVRTDIDNEYICSKPVFKEKFALLLPKGHWYSVQRQKDISMLAKEPFISFAKECGPALVNSVVNICAKSGFIPNIVHETSQINSILRLVESGLGYSIIPCSAEEGYGLNLDFIPLTGYAETAQLYMIYKNGNKSPVLENFISLLHD